MYHCASDTWPVYAGEKVSSIPARCHASFSITDSFRFQEFSRGKNRERSEGIWLREDSDSVEKLFQIVRFEERNRFEEVFVDYDS